MSIKRNTLQKQMIFDAVRELNIHATAEQVYDYVSVKNPFISKATVYRNLSQMAETGELFNAGALSGATHYDHNTHDHYHFICKECNAVFDVDGDFPDMTNIVKKSGEFEVTDCNMSFSGLCHKCKV
ncbi:MAG: transcriptional repressor [Firmicutes bacterium]|nr:transcriptional repressor [Bacillota bacterium]